MGSIDGTLSIDPKRDFDEDEKRSSRKDLKEKTFQGNDGPNLFDNQDS